MDIEQPVSNRAFAIMVGQTEGAVRKAIARQSIKDGLVVVDGRRMILPGVAAKEWGKEFVKPLVDEPEVKDQVVTVDVKVPDAEADSDTDDELDDSSLRGQIPSGITKAEADRILSILRARKVQLELDELEGRLVDKKLVFQSLAEIGITIRNTFMNVPGKCLGNIIAADTYNERMILFEDAIANALKSIVALDNPIFKRK